jgi:hypothetical protein
VSWLLIIFLTALVLAGYCWHRSQDYSATTDERFANGAFAFVSGAAALACLIVAAFS